MGSEIIKYPVSTEKSMRMMESENKIIFAVSQTATKKEIKDEIERIFKVKVESVNTQISKGEKKAYVKFSSENPAIDIATQLGMM